MVDSQLARKLYFDTCLNGMRAPHKVCTDIALAEPRNMEIPGHK